MKLLTLLEVSPDALVMADAAGRIVSVNGQAQALFGYSCADLIGQPLEVLLPERFRAAHALHRHRYATAPRTRPMGAGPELYGQCKDGREFPVDISLSPLLFDGSLHVLAAIRDMTARSRLEARERAARETAEARLALLQLVLDELPTCVYFVTGAEARLVLANRAAVTLWGSEWPVGQPLRDFLSAHHIHLFDTNGQALPPAAFAPLCALQEGQTVFHRQETIRHADGTRLPVLLNAVALDGRLLAGLAASGQPSSLSSAEPAALVVVQDITPLKEAERLKDQFLGLVAHELRNPLAALKGFAQTLLRHSQMGQQSSRHQLTLSTSLSRLVAQADGGRIEQVLTNLLTNAIKYSPDGGPVEVTLLVATEGQEALLSIRDHGIGIPQAEQAQLFGRFVRASNGEAQGISGTGLGLDLCRELVAQHGGDIWFESTEGVGSTFLLRLPLSPNPPSHT